MGMPARNHATARRPGLRASAAATLLLLASAGTVEAAQCAAERTEAMPPADPALCEHLSAAIRDPSALPLDRYQAQLNDFLGNWCHRDEAAGWQRDKRVRDTGPFTAALVDRAWQGTGHGTHAPVVIWYSPEMLAWLVEHRTGEAEAEPPPVPDGAIMVKEMFPYPAGACDAVDPLKLFPTSGAAIMIRDRQASHDGWYWGWYGFGPSSGWAPDWPPTPGNPLANQGFAQYCLNCHASARDNLTFASPRNIQGQPGEPLVFLSQSFFEAAAPRSHHEQVTLPHDRVRRLGEPHYRADRDLLKTLRAHLGDTPSWDTVVPMPSETYDNTWVAAGGPTAADTFLTSSQCLGCHDAGSTGLQFDMTQPNPYGDNLFNLSPYATWRTSPMGLAGRDPFFFAQLASETQSFHPDSKALVEDTCLGCHGIQGQRQFHIDRFAESGECQDFTRTMVDAVPWPDGNPSAPLADYGMLARDGISCTSCHRMALGPDSAGLLAEPQNACVEERQALLNPHNSGFARTFTGSFPVGAPDRLIGPFEDPRVKPMENALGNTPEHHASITSSEVCGSCHTVHLPILQAGQIIGYTYEQTTYPEWAFSAYRTGETPDGELPHGAGADAQSCQDCHMPSRTADGTPLHSRIASIQEYSRFPQAEHSLGPEETDLPVRDGFALHTLVGLNVFLVKMAQQFPDVLGIRTQDPMLVSRGVDPLIRTEQAMLDMAHHETATVTLSEVSTRDGSLDATVTVTSKVGHKFPSGVGFRRAFLDFRVLDQNGETLWASGRTDAAGVLVDQDGNPLEGEHWWESDCSARIEPEARLHQPHYQRITAQDQAQIYQELVSTPPPGADAAACGRQAEAQGRLTTSFLSICGTVKDNRILPHGYLPEAARKEIAAALGAGEDLAIDAGAYAVGDDPDYRDGGADSLVYSVPLDELPAGRSAAAVQATLYYQATPPFYLQDRFCTAQGTDADRLRFLVGHLNLDGTAAEGWKLEVTSSGPVPLAGH